MGIDLKEFADKVIQMNNHIEFETQLDDEKVTLRASIGAKEFFDDHISLTIYFSKRGYIMVSFIFDKIDKSLLNYNLINEFNEYTLFKGFISGDGFFQVDVARIGIDTTDEALSFLFFNLESILEENTLLYLTPILKITK